MVDGKTTKQIEQEIASAMGPAVLSSQPLYPNLKDRDDRNNKPFDGSEIQLLNLSANSVTIDINDPSVGILTKFKYSDNNQSTDLFGDPVTIVALFGLLALGYIGYIWIQNRKKTKETDQ